MAFIATTGTPTELTSVLWDLLGAYAEIKELALQVRGKAEADLAQCALGADADYVVGMVQGYTEAATQLTTLSQTPRLGEVAKIIEGSDSYDVVAEFLVMLAAIQDVVSTLRGAIPKDVNGYVLLFTLGDTGELVPRWFSPETLTSAQLGLVERLTAVRDSIA
jgi:hypothetical protein